MVWLAGGMAVGVLLIACGLWWWRRNRPTGHKLVSLVVLLREPRTLDPAVLAATAGRAWGLDLGDGTGEGEDGFVVGQGITCAIRHGTQMTVVNALPQPYVPDVEAAAAGIADRRVRDLFLAHRAWFSCDALGIDARTPGPQVQAAYRALGKLMAALLDDDCLLLYVPDAERAYPLNEETEAALRADDPLAELHATATVPILEVDSDDPVMCRAVAEARRTWPEFAAAFERQAGRNFTVKAPVTRAGNTEFIWIDVTCIEGDRVYGLLANEPGNLGPLRLGSKVSVLADEVNDWCFLDPAGKLAGGFTIPAVQQASRRPRKS